MSKLQKRTLDAVGWLGSSGYQTIVYSSCAKDNRAKTTVITQKTQPKAVTRPEDRTKN